MMFKYCIFKGLKFERNPKWFFVMRYRTNNKHNNMFKNV